MVDISVLFDTHLDEQEAGREFPIAGPSREATGIIMRICGPDSDRLRKARHIVKDRILWRNRRGTHIRRGKDVEEDDNELVAAAIMDWSGILKGGEPFPYSKENAEYLISRYPFIKDQVDVFCSTRAFFDPDFDPFGKTDDKEATETASTPEVVNEVAV